MNPLKSIRHSKNMRRIKRDIARGRMSVLCGSEPVLDNTDVHFVETVNHAALMIPSDCQGNHPSCGGHATMNLIEWVMNTSGNPVPKNQQMDGYRLWKEKRLEEYGNLNGGLMLHEAVEAAIERDIIVGSYTYVSASEALAVLPSRPLLCGIKITTEWPRASKDNGFIRSGGLTTGPHAEVLVGATINAGRKFVHLLNSWGTNHAWKGIETISLELFLKRCFACIDIQAVPSNPEKYLKRWRG
jgi:hypothetical protein